MFLRVVNYDVVADPNTAIAKAVEAANYNPIVMAFNIEALGKDEAAVIDVVDGSTSAVESEAGAEPLRRPGCARHSPTSVHARSLLHGWRPFDDLALGVLDAREHGRKEKEVDEVRIELSTTPFEQHLSIPAHHLEHRVLGQHRNQRHRQARLRIADRCEEEPERGGEGELPEVDAPQLPEAEHVAEVVAAIGERQRTHLRREVLSTENAAAGRDRGRRGTGWGSVRRSSSP